MKKVAFACMISLSLTGPSLAQDVWVTVDNDVLNQVQTSLDSSYQTVHSAQGDSLLKLDTQKVESLAHIIHDKLHRCGGFIAHESYQEAFDSISYQGEMYFSKSVTILNYKINQQKVVHAMVPQLEEMKIRDMIIKLSSFKTRHHKSPTGLESTQYIQDEWKKIIAHRNDAKVELFAHRETPQPSVILTLKGSESPDDILVIGGHADSLAGFFGGANSTAPGADDNASGIATRTEILRVLMQNGFQPKKTVMFMAYAAEEVGLVGSKEIAQKFKQENKNVLGVVQFDMTLFKGTADKDIVMMTDYTNTAQNEFLGQLIDEYVKVSWGYSRCGYGCSDHASWTNAGFPASMPFESNKGDMNRHIHSAKDTLQNSGGNASHALKFAKLGLAYLVELAN